MNLLMDALKFCQSQLTGHPLVCWELVSGGIKRNLSMCVFSGKTNLDCVGWDRGEVFFFFTPQLRITWQGKCLSHWNGCRWGGGEGVTAEDNQPFSLYGSQDDFQRKLLPWYGQCPFKSAPLSHSYTRITFHISAIYSPTLVCGVNRYYYRSIKSLSPSRGVRNLLARQLSWLGSRRQLKKKKNTHNAGDRTLR